MTSCGRPLARDDYVLGGQAMVCASRRVLIQKRGYIIHECPSHSHDTTHKYGHKNKVQTLTASHQNPLESEGSHRRLITQLALVLSYPPPCRRQRTPRVVATFSGHCRCRATFGNKETVHTETNASLAMMSEIEALFWLVTAISHWDTDYI